MSSLVLARKYRPRTFSQMVGQDHVVRAIGNALASGRLHHAYLFTGTRGIGKTTISRILAKSLNCTGPDGQGGVTAEPCGRCQACVEIDADRYLDYIELDAASNRSIDEIRDLIERAAYKPAVGRFKLFMIDEAHQLTKDAFNALLKTLEEPPDYLKFVLATTDPEKMLPTVLSRCLQFNLRPMAPDTIADHLRQVLQAERVAADEGALRALARAARGSMRDALSLTDQAIAYGAGALVEAGVRTMLGVVDQRHARDLIAALAVRDGAAVLATVQALREQGASAAGTLDEMALLLQRMAVQQAVPGALDMSDPASALAEALAPQMAPDDTQLLYSIVVHGRAELPLVSDEHAALTMVLLRMLAFPAGGQPVAAAAPGSGARSTPRPAPAAVDAPAAPTSQPLRANPREPRLAAPASPLRSPPPAASPAPTFVASGGPGEPPAWLDAPWQDEAAAAPAAAAVMAKPPAQEAPAAASVRSSSPGPRDAPVSVSLEPTPLGEQWAARVAALNGLPGFSGMARELALQAGLDRAEPGADAELLTLVVERESLRAPALVDKLTGWLSDGAPRPVRIEVRAGVPTDSPSLRESAARARAQAEAESVIREDPTVRGLLAQFPTARIVPGSIRPPPLAAKD
ncbi:MAG: DNA polymerase III subunit gamma/tau [Aquabacterium sp.]